MMVLLSVGLAVGGVGSVDRRGPPHPTNSPAVLDISRRRSGAGHPNGKKRVITRPTLPATGARVTRFSPAEAAMPAVPTTPVPAAAMPSS